MTMVKTKHGDEKKRLKQVSTEATLSFIVEFLKVLLLQILHHRNELEHFRSIVKEFRSQFNGVYMDLDYSENLTIPMKKQPQSLYWTQEAVTIHSGISKSKNGKIYHPTISSNKTHDQIMTNIAMNEILSEEDVDSHDVIIIDSDNCSSQYKSGLHFNHLQQIADTYGKPVIRMYGIPGHGKGEVDHVGGTAKVTVRRMAASGRVFLGADDITESLVEKYGTFKCPRYVIKTISEKELETARKEAKRTKVKPVKNSSLLHVMVFRPHDEIVKGARRLCICNQCQNEYGSCANFSSITLQVQYVHTPWLRNQNEADNEDDDEDGDGDQEEEDDEYDSDYIYDFLQPGSYVAVAPDSHSRDLVWFIKVSQNDCIAGDNEIDSYGNQIIPGHRFLKGQFLNFKHQEKRYYLFTLAQKEVTYFYKETIIYLFVDVDEDKKECKIMSDHYSNILSHIGETGYAKFI